MILVLTTVLPAFLAGCGGPPAHPPGVPAEAQWGGEGAQGIFLKVGSHQGTLWQLEVWDRKGQRLGGGAFRLRGFAKARIIPEEVVAFESGILRLKDGTVLVPEGAPAP